MNKVSQFWLSWLNMAFEVCEWCKHSMTITYALYFKKSYTFSLFCFCCSLIYMPQAKSSHVDLVLPVHTVTVTRRCIKASLQLYSGHAKPSTVHKRSLNHHLSWPESTSHIWWGFDDLFLFLVDHILHPVSDETNLSTPTYTHKWLIYLICFLVQGDTL